MTIPQRNPTDRRQYDRRPEGPRRVRHGMKLSSAVDFSASPLASRWIRLIEDRFDSTILSAGLEYARAGQIVSMEFLPGAVEAQVQGTAAVPYRTRLAVPSMTAMQWETVIESLANETRFVAKLLAGEMPLDMDELFHSAGASILPATAAHITTSCTCSKAGSIQSGAMSPVESDQSPCKHAAAVAYLIAQRLTEIPMLVFTLLGLSAEQVLERVRRQRTLHAHGSAAAHVDPMIPESKIAPLPLEACLDEFWRGGHELADLERLPPLTHLPHALLRRLGPSPLQGRFPMVGLLASVYDTVSLAAQQWRDAGEEPTDSDAAGEPDSGT